MIIYFSYCGVCGPLDTPLADRREFVSHRNDAYLSHKIKSQGENQRCGGDWEVLLEISLDLFSAPLSLKRANSSQVNLEWS